MGAWLLRHAEQTAAALRAAGELPSQNERNLPTVSGALERSVYERGLVTRHVSAESVLREHAGFHYNVSRRLSPGRALGFVSGS